MKLQSIWKPKTFAVLPFVLLVVANQACGDFTTLAGFGSKWGDPLHGTVSDTITWSFMNDLTGLAASHPLINEVSGGVAAGSNVTSLRSSFDLANGAGSFNTAIQNAFNTWSAASNGRVTFLQVADNGAIGGDSNNLPSSAVDIRIGAFHSVSNSGFAQLRSEHKEWYPAEARAPEATALQSRTAARRS